MQEDPQAAEQRRRMGLPAGMDPRNYDSVAALAWNDALAQLLNPTIESSLLTLHVPTVWAVLVKAIIITLIAVIAVVILNRVARRMVKQSALNTADAESMM